MPEPADTDCGIRSTLTRRVLGAEGPLRLHLAGQMPEVQMPRSVLAAPAQVLESSTHGESVTVVRSRAKLTAQQPAGALHVSRLFLIVLLDAGRIEHRTVGHPPPCQSTSLIRFLREDDGARPPRLRPTRWTRRLAISALLHGGSRRLRRRHALPFWIGLQRMAYPM